MGIKNLKNYLDNKYQISKKIPLTSFKGKKIAIDISNWMYQNMCVSRKIVLNKTEDLNFIDKSKIELLWYNKFLKFIWGWLQYDILPIIVFDGMSLAEKHDVISKRRLQKTERKMKINELYKNYKDDILLESKLREELKNDIYIEPSYYDKIKILMDNIGVPYMYAKNDAEKLCSSLCIEGHVDIVYSNDTDNFVFGCPLTAMGHGSKIQRKGQKIPTLNIYYLDDILNALSLTHSQFVDFSIFLGCDYNNRKSFGCNLEPILQLFKTYQNIENLPKELITPDLNHIRCREIFKYTPSYQLIVIGYYTENGNTFFNNTPSPFYNFTLYRKTQKSSKQILDELTI